MRVGLDQFGRPGRYRGIGRVDRGTQYRCGELAVLPVLVHVAQCTAEIRFVRRLRFGPCGKCPELMIARIQGSCAEATRQSRMLAHRFPVLTIAGAMIGSCSIVRG